MILKIITIVMLVEVCAGDSHHEPHSSVKHAVSSQSFVRHDIPISYKHSEIHVYSTQKPHIDGPKPITPSHQLKKMELFKEFQQQEIQYAPIVREKKTEFAIPNTSKEPPKKLNLEPNLYNHQGLALGHNMPNLQVLQAVNRYPGHNAVYRSYSNGPYDNFNKQHNENQQIVYDRKPETTAPPSIYEFVPKQYKTGKSHLYQLGTEQATLQPAEVKVVALGGYPLHPKTHRLLVNIARAYNFAKQPAQAQKEPTRILRKPATLTKNSNLQIAKAINEIKTRLYPVKYKGLPQYS